MTKHDEVRKAWAVINKGTIVYRCGILDALAVFSDKKSANCFAIAVGGNRNQDLAKTVVPCEITYPALKDS